MSKDNTLTLSRRKQVNNHQQKPKKPKAWNHQIELKSLIGSEVSVTTARGEKVLAVLKECDQFTVKVGSSIIFKGQIESIIPAKNLRG